MDLIFSDNFNKTILLKGDGTGSFNSEQTLASFDFTVASAFYDNDSDGDLDFYLMEQGVYFKGDYVASLRKMVNVGTNSVPKFSKEYILNNTSNEPFYIDGSSVTHAAFDFDKDGDCDFFIGNIKSIYYVENYGNNTFKVVDTIVTSSTSAAIFKPVRATLGDLNNDNAVDLIYVAVKPFFSMPQVFVKWGIPDNTKNTFNNKNKGEINYAINLNVNNGNVSIKNCRYGNRIIGIYDMQGRKIVSYKSGVLNVKLREFSVRNKCVIILLKNNKGEQFKRIVSLL